MFRFFNYKLPKNNLLKMFFNHYQLSLLTKK